MAYPKLLRFYTDIAPITRAYVAACVLTTVAVQMSIVSPNNLEFKPDMIVGHNQWWRLVTPFLFFGTLSLNFLFNIAVVLCFGRLHEEMWFRGRRSGYLMMLIFSAVTTLAFAYFADFSFPGKAFPLMLSSVWSRRYPRGRIYFFRDRFIPVRHLFLAVYLGFFNVTVFLSAQLVSLIMFVFSFLVGNPIQIAIIGYIVGHIYHVLEDVFPNQRGGFRILRTPRFMKALFDTVEERPNHNSPAERRATD